MGHRWRIALVLLLITIAGWYCSLLCGNHNSKVIFTTTDPGAVTTLSRTPEPKASEMIETQDSTSINKVGPKITVMTIRYALYAHTIRYSILFASQIH